VIQGPIKFYIACIQRAFLGWFGKVSGWAGALALTIGVGLLFIDLPQNIDDLAAKAEPVFFLSVFVAILAVRLLLAPFWLYNEEREAHVRIEMARRPALAVSLPDPAILNSISLDGNTSQSLAGTRNTIIRRWEMDVLALHCSNQGEIEAEQCRARLLSAVRLKEDGTEDLGVVEAIALPWDKLDSEGSHLTNIPPAETRRIWIGGVRSRGHLWLFRDVNALPIEYQQLLGSPGTYRILIQIDAHNVPPQQISLEIICSEGAPVQNGIIRGTIDVKVVAQGAPRVS
jgi:hypothetical protein